LFFDVADIPKAYIPVVWTHGTNARNK